MYVPDLFRLPSDPESNPYHEGHTKSMQKLSTQMGDFTETVEIISRLRLPEGNLKRLTKTVTFEQNHHQDTATG